MSGYRIFAGFYDMLTGNVDYAGYAGTVDRLIQKHNPALRGGLLLDLACGTGNMTMALGTLGYEVIGVDSSSDMLSVAMQKAAEVFPKPLFLCQDMTELDLYGTVGVTVCALDSVNHLPNEAALDRVVERVALFTEPGGLFLFDVNTAYKHRQILADNVYVYELEGLYCVWQNHYRSKNDRVDITLDFFEEQPDGSYRRQCEALSERIYSAETIASSLTRHGFEVLEILDGESGKAPSDDAQRLLYAVQRKQHETRAR